MPGLHHLDDMPVSDKERRLARAFLEGGLEVSVVTLSPSSWLRLLTCCVRTLMVGSMLFRNAIVFSYLPGC